MAVITRFQITVNERRDRNILDLLRSRNILSTIMASVTTWKNQQANC